MSLGKNISKYRKKENLSQESLAEKIQVTRQTISNWELDITIPDTYQAIRLSTALNVELEQLIPKEYYKNELDVWEKFHELLMQEIDADTYKIYFDDLEYIGIESQILKVRCPYYSSKKTIKDEHEELIVKLFNMVSNNKISGIKCYEKEPKKSHIKETEEEKKKTLILILLQELNEPLLEFFDTKSNKDLDLKIKVLAELCKGKTIAEIPNFYDILELYPIEEDGVEYLWD